MWEICSYIAPGAVLGGEVIIGCEAHIGLNSSVKQTSYNWEKFNNRHGKCRSKKYIR